MKSYVIRRRKRGTFTPPAEQPAAIQWVVRYRFAGRVVTTDGSYDCPSEAKADARKLRRTEGLDAWATVA